MPRIYYSADGYTGNYAHINTHESFIKCRKVDLYRSIITVGNPSFFNWRDVRTNGFFRTLSNSIIQKILLVQANIQCNALNATLHPIYDSYVSDQKRIVSYNLGMAVAKLYAERLLKIPNLIHVESLKKVGAITFINQDNRSKEPDLVGTTNETNWHVFEAKGTSSDQLNRKINEAKEQARQVDKIHGVEPETLSACATSFGYTRILSRIVDPPSGKGKELEIDKNKFYDQYYSPFFALRETRNIKFNTNSDLGIKYNSIDIRTKELNLTIGLDTEVYEYLQEKNYDKINDYYDKNKNLELNTINIGQNSRGPTSIGIDGFIVKYRNR